MSIADAMQSIETSAMSIALRDAAYAYPIIEGTHVLSLALSVGMILWFDLRLLGFVLRAEPVRALYASIRPWLLAGFFLMVVTGVLLFLMRPAHILGNTYFQIKLALLFLSLINIIAYHFLVERNADKWDSSGIPPVSARLAGGLSLVLWFSIITVGRFMAYSL